MRFYRDDLPPTIETLIEIERKEGYEEGEEKSKKDIALTLFYEGFEIDYIAKLTKLSVSEVNKLKESLL